MTSRLQAVPIGALGDVQFRVEVGLGISDEGGDVWAPDPDNEAKWNESTWAASEPFYVDVTRRTLQASTSRGRDRWESRFVTGSAGTLLDNQDGILSLDSNQLGPIPLRPGRWWRLAGRVRDPEIVGEGFLLSETDGTLSGMRVGSSPPPIPVAGYRVTFSGRCDAAGQTSDSPLVSMYSAAAANRLFQVEVRADGSIRAIIAHDGGGTQTRSLPGPYFDVDVDVEVVVDYGLGVFSLTVNGDEATIAPSGTGPNTYNGTLRVGARGFTTASQYLVGRVNSATYELLDGRPLAVVDPSDPEILGPLQEGDVWTDVVGNGWVAGRGLEVVGQGVPTQWEILYVGQIDTMADVYRQAAEAIDSRWDLLDWFMRWSIDNPPALEVPVGGGERTDERVARILDLAGWSEDYRDLQEGAHTMPASTLAQSYLEEMQGAADAEGGAFFISRSGIATFKARDWLETDERSVQIQWGAGAPGDSIQVVDASTDWSTSRVRNDIQFARVGGEAIRVVGEKSLALYGQRTYRRFDLECETDEQIQALASRYLAAFQYDRTRLESVTVIPTSLEGARSLLTTEVGDRVRLRISTLPGWSFTGEYWVNRIRHNVSADDWTVTLRVDSTDLRPPIQPGEFAFEEFSEAFKVGVEDEARRFL